MGKRFVLIPLISLMLLGCEPEPYMVRALFTNGSTGGGHIVNNMVITTKLGGRANFAMGAVNGYPGAHSSGGRMDAPAYIEGSWAKEVPNKKVGLLSYHRISMKVPEDAEAKMRLMDNYYKYFDQYYSFMEVIVDGPRVRIFYTKACYSKVDDCTPKQNVDPNGWVIDSPSGTTKVVKLFDGIGESSATPFPKPHVEVRAHKTFGKAADNSRTDGQVDNKTGNSEPLKQKVPDDG